MLCMEKRTDLKIPYGIADFKRIRNEGLYYVDKTEYLARLEERDRFVFFVRPSRSAATSRARSASKATCRRSSGTSATTSARKSRQK